MNVYIGSGVVLFVCSVEVFTGIPFLTRMNGFRISDVRDGDTNATVNKINNLHRTEQDLKDTYIVY